MAARDLTPAFPTDVYYDEERINVLPGMTLRDWFAGQSMHGILHVAASKFGGEFFWVNIATDAYRMADAMMEARKKPGGS